MNWLFHQQQNLVCGKLHHGQQEMQVLDRGAAPS